MLSTRLNIGSLDRRISILQAVEETDEYNQNAVTAWDILCNRWASVREDKGGESYMSEQITVSRVTVFTIRFREGITEKMRVMYLGRFYEILSITSPNRYGTMELKTSLLDET